MSSGHVSDIVNPPLMTRSGHRSGRKRLRHRPDPDAAASNCGARPTFESKHGSGQAF